MPITESRLKAGTLTLDALPFATQATNVTLTPDVDEEGDRLEVLSGDALEPDDVESWVLHIEAIQDFDDPAGFVRFLFENAGTVVPYSWKPSATGDTWSGTVKVRASEIGGDVNTRLTTEVDLPCQERPTVAESV
jgi:hypothetical protein